MKRKNTTQYLKWLGMVCLGLASLPVRAGDQTFSFDTDPSLDPLFLLAGSNEGSAWWGTGGNPSSGGYLELTPAVNSQTLCIVFPDVDQGYPVKAFKLTLDARVGNGTTERPADGFSISYCREGDPILVNATNNTIGGAAGGDDAATTLNPAGSGDLENGSKTGVSILFDSWQGNWLPDTGAGGVPGPDTEGIAVRVDDKTLIQIPFGATERNGGCSFTTQPDISVCQAAACAATNSMQTGPWDGGSGTLDVLCWAPLEVELNVDKQVTVKWKGATLLDKYQLAQYNSHRGRLVLMGRTGGNNQNVNFDNIHLVTTPAIEATFGSVRAVGLNGFEFTIEDNGISVVTNVPAVTLDNVDVTANCIVTKAGGTTTVKYSQAANFASASTHAVSATWQTDLGQSLNVSGQTFTVIPWITLPESYAVTSVDTARPGFFLQPYQTITNTAADIQPNRLYWTDEQLLGRHGTNTIAFDYVTDSTNNSLVAWNGMVDFSNDTTPPNGQFAIDNSWSSLGIPGIDTVFATPEDNTSMAAMGYAYFPTAGTYIFGGNSDDGIRLTFAPNSHSIMGLEVPGVTADGGRGIAANQSNGGVIITKPGYYGFRFLFENGGGGCDVEFYTSQTPAGSTPLLVNDSGSAASVKVFMASTVAPPYVSSASPVQKYGADWMPITPLNYEITDSGKTVDASKVTLFVNGTAVAGATVNKAGNITTVVGPAPAAGWSIGTNNIELAYTDNLGSNYLVKDFFVVPTYVTLDPGMSAPLGSEDATKPGYAYKLVQAYRSGTVELLNRIYAGEQVIAGGWGENVANPATAATSIPGAINFDIGPAAQGYFTTANGHPEVLFPGIPGIKSEENWTNEAFAVEFKTWLEFKTAGIYILNFSSDDGFQISETPDSATHFGQLEVTAPVGVAGVKGALWGNAGQDIVSNSVPLTAKIVAMKSTTSEGCATIENVAALAGNIALVERGTCGFSVKAKAAYAAGAIAVVVGQSRPEVTPTEGAFPIEPGQASPADRVPIPVVMIHRAHYQALTNALATSEVTATLHPWVRPGLPLFEADYGKGAGDVVKVVKVDQPGLYPIRISFWQGGGGGNAEFEQHLADGTRTLVNDLTNPQALRAFRAVTVAPKPTLSIVRDGSVWKITYTGTLQSSGVAGSGYADVPGATSPYTVDTTAGNKFFRSRN